MLWRRLRDEPGCRRETHGQAGAYDGAMTRLGRRWRSEANVRMAEHDARMAHIEANLTEISDKLNGLIGVVENWPRQKPNRRQ